MKNIDIFSVPDKTWNDWQWHMSMQGFCSKVDFLTSMGFEVENNRSRKIALTPYLVKFLSHLKENDLAAYKAECLQTFFEDSANVDHSWSWATKKSFSKFQKFLPAMLKSLLWGKGSDTEIAALENFYPLTDVIIATARCARNCSFCFREVGDSKGEAAILAGGMKIVLAAVEGVIRRGTPHVLITGGDPLTRSNNQLRQILEPLVSSSSVQVIRLATRMVTDLPMRFFDQDLLTLLRETASRMRERDGVLRIVIHVNHPCEITKEALLAIRNIQDCSVELLSQTVALKEINDSVAVLRELFLTLDRLGVRPYKLFHPMPVYGTEHLRISVRKFRKLIAGLHQWLPGTAVPQANVPTLIGKMPVNPSGRFMVKIPFFRRVLVKNWRGEWHLYKDG